MVREWIAHLAIEKKDHDDEVKKKKIEAEAEASLRKMKGDPQFRRRR